MSEESGSWPRRGRADAVRDDGPVPPQIAPLLAPDDLDRLRRALAHFTVEAVHELLGPVGQAAHDRGDLAGVAREVARTGATRTAVLTRLFLLGAAVSEPDARRALDPLPVGAAIAAGLIEQSADEVRAAVEVRPYGEAAAEPPVQANASREPWWVVSDFGSDVRPGPLRADHVLGIGGASVTLAQATPRDPVARVADIGTGSGVQALHLARHARTVVATDVSERALRFAATTAALSRQVWDLRAGSLLEPLGDDRFDLIVANPPFVVSPGLAADNGGYEYRDSGLPGDAVSERLVRSLGGRLRPDGTAVLLANWIVPPDGDWSGRLARWLDGAGCDAWIWQREVAGPGEYATLWLRDAGLVAGTAGWNTAYHRWLAWFEEQQVAAVGMGLVALWRTDRPVPLFEAEDVRQPVEQPAGALLLPWLRRRRWLADVSDDQLLRSSLRPASDLVRVEDQVLGREGWSAAGARLRQLGGMRWEVEIDDAVSGVVAALDTSPDLRLPVELLAETNGVPTDQVTAALLPVVRDLVQRGFLLPAALEPARTAPPAMRTAQ